MSQVGLGLCDGRRWTADGGWGPQGYLLGGSKFREGEFREGRFRDGCTDGLSWFDCQVVDGWHMDGSVLVGLK